jgi:hypothetical protein
MPSKASQPAATTQGSADDLPTTQCFGNFCPFGIAQAAGKNGQEQMWLTWRLMPDFKTIANVRKK